MSQCFSVFLSLFFSCLFQRNKVSPPQFIYDLVWTLSFLLLFYQEFFSFFRAVPAPMFSLFLMALGWCLRLKFFSAIATSVSPYLCLLFLFFRCPHNSFFFSKVFSISVIRSSGEVAGHLAPPFFRGFFSFRYHRTLP